MKIESGWEVQPLANTPSGSLIYIDGNLYIVTTESHKADCTRACVNIESGGLMYRPNECLVAVIYEAVLIIGGYYK